MATRKGESISLGTAEIRVFGADGTIYAAPNLLYHYIAEHEYNPPAEFLTALHSQAAPPDPRYFDKLRALDLEWHETLR